MEEEQSVFICPACGRPLYDRRRPDCGYCGRPTPQEMRLTQAQADEIDRQLADERKREDEFKQAVDTLGPAIPDQSRYKVDIGAIIRQ